MKDPSRREAQLGTRISTVVACVCLLVVGVSATATAGGLTKGAVKKIAAKVVKKQAGTLSVLKAKQADHALSADKATTATSATSVGGITITPVSIALKEGDPAVLPLDVQGTQVEFFCGGGGLSITTRRGDSPAPPMTGTLTVAGQSTTFVRTGFGGGGGAGVQPHEAIIASVREASGRVTRLELTGMYLQDGYGGPEDCFAQGTLQRFGG